VVVRTFLRGVRLSKELISGLEADLGTQLGD